MASFRQSHRLARFAAVLASALAALTGALLTIADAAIASQGPGVAAGTASSFTQAMMAILVYGASALVVAGGLIGALRRP
jgi:hypothetical protein